MSALAGLAGALIVLGVAGVIVGLRPVPPAPARPGRRPLPSPDRRLLTVAAGGLAAGGAVAVVTGFVAALLAGPLVAVGVAWLLAAPPAALAIDRLDAMEEWTRLLAGKLRRGDMLSAALSETAFSAPAAIGPEVRALAADLATTRSSELSLRRFGERLADPTGDLLVANLILAARRDGAGLAHVLEGLAESVAEDVRIRREVEADRAKPRNEARSLTMVTLLVLGLLSFASAHTAPFGVWPGPLVLGGLLAAYVGALVWMRRVSAPPRVPRFLDLGAWQARRTPGVAS